MQLSVLCSEDSPRYVQEDITREAAGTLFGTRLLTGQVAACRFWPKGARRRRVLRAGDVAPCRRWCCRGSSTR